MCKLCNIKPVYEFTNKKKLCKRCFINYFQKKVLYTIRKFKMIKREDIVGYKKNNSFKGIVLKNILEFLSQKIGFNLVKSPGKRANKIAIDSSLDSEADKITHKLMEEDAKMKSAPLEGKIIKPLYLFLDEEILLYAKIKKLKFKKIKEKKDKISSFIDELEKKHPEVKRAIVNSILELYP